MSQFTTRCRELPMRTALKIASIAVAAFTAAVALACGMGFQPGWANGWPGLSKHIVFTAFMTVILCVMLLSAGAALFAVPCSLFQRFIKRSYVGWGMFISLMIVWAIVAVLIGIRAFPSIRSAIANDWP